ncbi:MAG: hypothetical protein NC244_05320 [Alistipes senegalensis]|nr:hypothetical protein [Alistipes senegalensis]
MNMALFSIDGSLLLFSYAIFFISMLIALVFLIKIIRTIKVYHKAKKIYPERIPILKKELKKYTIILISVLIFGFGQLCGVLYLYGLAMSNHNC